MASWYDPFGIFDDNSGDAYKQASQQFQKYADQAKAYQQPFYNAGVNSLDPYQQKLQQMSDPQAYYNSMMAGYNQSPYAQIQQQQAMNQANNFASANGLSGSTPMAMQMQQNAADISTADMDTYFKNLMGINSDYMGGLQNLITGGQGSANQLTNIFSNLGTEMGGAAYGSSALQNKGKQQLMSTLMMLLPALI